MAIDTATAVEQYRERFGQDPQVAARAPGRVNIIGEHTDYNHGFVLPMALEQETVILARERADGLLNAYAANLERSVQTPLGEWKRNPDEPWIDYVVGVGFELHKLGQPLKGADLLVAGDVPVGAGLSSSAALEMAALALFERLGDFTLEGPEGPRLGQRVENEFLGLSTGIMDQFISRMGKEGHALFLDCRSFDYELVEVAFESAQFVIANTNVSRGLTASKYNERVAECAQAVERMAGVLDRDATHLRDFSVQDLPVFERELEPVVFRRARHVICEDERTQAARRAMRTGDLAAVGGLMNASDDSLKFDYEVSCEELSVMTEVARTTPGCYGARMTGAGFGGCAVNLVANDHIDSFCERLMEQYRERTGIEGAIIVSKPSEGARAEALS
jgi:galactokinase